MIKYGLTGKLRRGFYGVATAGALGIGSLIGCNDGPTKLRLPPQTSLDVVPNSGIAPVNSRVRYACTDPDGAEDIAQSYLVIGMDTIRTKSLDSLVTFTQNTAVKGYCKDLDGQTSTAGPINVQVLQPSFSQTATLEPPIGINYSATLEYLASATRKILRNGNLIDTKIITGPSYSERLTNNLKGQSCFVLEATGVRPDTACVEVPNYLPEVNLILPNLNLYSGDSIVLNLQRPTDKNPEDNPVRYVSVRSLDGKTNPSINDSLLTIMANQASGQYQVEVGFGSTSGGLERRTLTGQILPDQIAFWSNLGGNEDIYSGDLVNDSLVNIRRLTTDPGQDLEPAWSPDGEYLAWATNRDGRLSIYIMKRDKTGLRKLTPTANIDFLSPSWSPDGTQIALSFIDRDLGTNGIARINSDGSGLITKLLENPGIGYLPEGIHWFKDGRIFYNDIIEGNSEIFSINPNGGGKTRITNTPYNETLPNVSPIGDRLAFVSDQFGGEFSGLEIMSMAINGTDIRRVTNTFEMEVDPKYSNDGTRLLYARWNSVINAWQMNLINPEGTWEILLSIDGRYPAWRPRQ